MEHLDEPRILPALRAERSAEMEELLGGVVTLGSEASNAYATIVRHPELFRVWQPFARMLLHGQLPARDRELLILRTAWHVGSDYEWGHHVLVAAKVGLTTEEIERVVEGPAANQWDVFDATLFRAVDELHSDARIGPGTWRTLASRYNEAQLIELPMLVGQYAMVAMTLASLGVQREPGIDGLPVG